MNTEARTQVETILSNLGVTFIATYRGERANALWGTTPMDAWDCMFRTTSGDAAQQFDFFTGLGHRKGPDWGPGPGMFGAYDNGPKPQPGTILHRQWQALKKPQAPHAADVLSCLISDAQSVGSSFEDWCADLGYDFDSRKAYRTYEACREVDRQLRVFFSPEALQALQDALQDY